MFACPQTLQIPNEGLCVGIIGGSGLDDPDLLADRTEMVVETPYGSPSDSLIAGQIDGVQATTCLCLLLLHLLRAHCNCLLLLQHSYRFVPLWHPASFSLHATTTGLLLRSGTMNVRVLHTVLSYVRHNYIVIAYDYCLRHVRTTWYRHFDLQCLSYGLCAYMFAHDYLRVAITPQCALWRALWGALWRALRSAVLGAARCAYWEGTAGHTSCIQVRYAPSHSLLLCC